MSRPPGATFTFVSVSGTCLRQTMTFTSVAAFQRGEASAHPGLDVLAAEAPLVPFLVAVDDALAGHVAHVVRADVEDLRQVPRLEDLRPGRQLRKGSGVDRAHVPLL